MRHAYIKQRLFYNGIDFIIIIYYVYCMPIVLRYLNRSAWIQHCHKTSLHTWVMGTVHNEKG